MSTINITNLYEKNKKIAENINILGEILMNENTMLYNEYINENFDIICKCNIKNYETERNTLTTMYFNILEKLKKIEY